MGLTKLLVLGAGAAGAAAAWKKFSGGGDDSWESATGSPQYGTGVSTVAETVAPTPSEVVAPTTGDDAFTESSAVSYTREEEL